MHIRVSKQACIYWMFKRHNQFSVPMCVCISLGAQMVKNLPAKHETLVRSLGQEDPLEKGMATWSSILAWWIPWTEKSGGLWGCKESLRLQRVTRNWVTNTCVWWCSYYHLSFASFLRGFAFLFSWGWPCSLSPVQCHEPLSIWTSVHSSSGTLSDLVP